MQEKTPTQAVQTRTRARPTSRGHAPMPLHLLQPLHTNLGRYFGSLEGNVERLISSTLHYSSRCQRGMHRALLPLQNFLLIFFFFFWLYGESGRMNKKMLTSVALMHYPWKPLKLPEEIAHFKTPWSNRRVFYIIISNPDFSDLSVTKHDFISSSLTYAILHYYHELCNGNVHILKLFHPVDVSGACSMKTPCFYL